MCYYTILADDTTTNQFIKIRGLENLQDYPIRVTYDKKFTYLANDSDVCELPDDFAERIVANIVAGEWLYGAEQTVAGSTLLTIGYSALDQMFSEYALPIKPYRETVQVRSMDGIEPPIIGDKRIIYVRP